MLFVQDLSRHMRKFCDADFRHQSHTTFVGVWEASRSRRWPSGPWSCLHHHPHSSRPECLRRGVRTGSIPYYFKPSIQGSSSWVKTVPSLLSKWFGDVLGTFDLHTFHQDFDLTANQALKKDVAFPILCLIFDWKVVSCFHRSARKTLVQNVFPGQPQSNLVWYRWWISCMINAMWPIRQTQSLLLQLAQGKAIPQQTYNANHTHPP